MPKLSPISAADLLRVLQAAGAADLGSAALSLGFVPVRSESTQKVRSEFAESSGDNPPTGDDGHGEKLQQPVFQFPTNRPSQQFWQASETTTLQPSEPKAVPGNPISDSELQTLAADKKLPQLLPIPWRRTVPFLRRRAGRMIVGQTVDLRALLKRAATGNVIAEIPRLHRPVWAAPLVVLWDDSADMYPFAADVQQLVQRLQREVGTVAVRLVRMLSADEKPVLPLQAPVLLVSTLGLFREQSSIPPQWLQLAQSLQQQGHRLTALCPLPSTVLHGDVAVAWNAVAWDLGQRFPRQVRHAKVPTAARRAADAVRKAAAASQQAAEILLDLLATAARIDQALLRQTRARLQQQDPNADALAEYLAWYHADCWSSVACCGLKPGEPYVRRLQNRQRLYQTSPNLVQDVQALIDQQHSAYSCALQLETELRSWNERSSLQQKQAREQLQRVVDRLRQLALEPASAAGRNSGLPGWFNAMIQRLPPQICSTAQLAPLIAEGLALTDTWLQEERELPEGVPEQQYREQLQAAAQRIGAGQQLDLDVGLQGTELVLRSGGQTLRPWWPLGQLQAVSSRHLTVSVVSDTGERQLFSRLLESGSAERISLPPQARTLRLETPAARLQLDKVPRPPWARRFWQDACGTAAEFRIGDVPFLLRWIPSGRFLMGSPENEQGRSSDEGPQHQVTISRGFWLGETPVTQQQWKAVVQACSGSDLPADPSDFKNQPLHPVESVNWHKCVQFCDHVQALLRSDEQFRLPTEAEWEYACRAGTSGAFQDGSPCTAPEGSDPALEKLGWYGKNSGGKTQPVGLKQCNGWGLYDMHGNVWEWCRDGQRPYGAEPQVNPVGPQTSGASRVLRGCGWSVIAGRCRAAYRFAFAPGIVWHYFGLRLSAGPQ